MQERSNLAAHYFSLLIAFTASLTLQEWTLLISIAIGIATLFINWHYKAAHLHLARKAAKNKNTFKGKTP